MANRLKFATFRRATGTNVAAGAKRISRNISGTRDSR